MAKKNGIKRNTLGEVHFTGRVFRDSRFDERAVGYTAFEENKFQLEAVINGQTTRLQSDGPFPENCLYDQRHSGLELKGILESWPALYEVGCSCGYYTRMKDVNAGFRYYSTVE